MSVEYDLGFEAKHKVIIAVEGKTEALLFRAFIAKQFKEEADEIYIANYAGEANLRGWLSHASAALSPGENRVLAITADREECVDTTSIVADINQALPPGFPQITAPNQPAGDWQRPPYACLYLYLFPNEGKGSVETMLLDYVKAPKDLECARQYMACLNVEGDRYRTEAQKDKVITEAIWIASLVRGASKNAHESFYSSFSQSFSASGNTGPWDFEALKGVLSGIVSDLLQLAGD